MVEEALYALLKPLVPSGEVYALGAPAGAQLPAISYRRVTRRTEFSHDGGALLHRDRYQITVLAKDYAAMRSLRDGVASLLSNNRAQFILSQPTGGDFTAPDQRDEDLRISSRDYYIWTRP